MTVGWRFVIHVKVLLKLDVFLLQVEHVPEAGGVVVQLELDQRVQVVEAHVLGLHDGGDGAPLPPLQVLVAVHLLGATPLPDHHRGA